MANPIYGTEIFAWVLDDPTGEHGIPATRPVPVSDLTGALVATAMPLITTRREAAERMRPYAETCANLTGLPIQLLHYKYAGVVDEIKPRRN